MWLAERSGGRQAPSGPARGRGAATSVTSQGSSPRSCGGFRNAAVRGRGRGPGRVGRGSNKGAEKSAEDLDKELDSYHARPCRRSGETAKLPTVVILEKKEKIILFYLKAA